MGVNVSQAFHRTSANPIDDSLVLTKRQMLNMNPDIMPSHYFAICIEDNGLYIYDKTQQTPDIATGYFKKFVSDVNPMIFMGLVGTESGCVYDSTTFPAASASNKGYVYKVVTDATYQGVAAKLGDTLISTGTAWVLIPSGDETTYTQGTGITISGANNAISVDFGTTAGTVCEGNDSRFNNIFYKNATNTVSGNTTFSGTTTFSGGVTMSASTVFTTPKLRINSTSVSANKNGGIYYYNGTTDYLLIGQGSSNMWIGANESTGTHHLGNLYISAGAGDNTDSHAYISRLIGGTRGNYEIPAIQTSASVPSSMATGVLYLISG